MWWVIVMITGDFLAMSLTTDRVRPSQAPNIWQIGSITSAGFILGGCFLAFCTALLAVGKFELGLGVEALRTLFVVAIVYGSHDLRHTGRSPHVGTSTDGVAGPVLSCRSFDHHHAGDIWNRHGPAADGDIGGRIHCRCHLWVDLDAVKCSPVIPIQSELSL